MHYYPHHIGDYLSHTANLTLLEHGVYLRLLQCYYMQETPLTGDIKRMIGARSTEESEAVFYVLKIFFIETEAGYIQPGADKRIAEYRDKSNKARKAVEVRWHNERNSDVSKSDTDVSNNNTGGILTNNHKPITNNQDKNILPAKAGKANNRKKLPDDFVLTERLRDNAVTYWHSKNRTDLSASEQWLKFINHHRSKGSRMADWDCAWVTWYTNAVEFTKPQFLNDINPNFVRRTK